MTREQLDEYLNTKNLAELDNKQLRAIAYAKNLLGRREKKCELLEDVRTRCAIFEQAISDLDEKLEKLAEQL